MVSVDVKYRAYLLLNGPGEPVWPSGNDGTETDDVGFGFSLHGSAWFKQANKQTNVIINKSMPTDNNRMCLGASNK